MYMCFWYDLARDVYILCCRTKKLQESINNLTIVIRQKLVTLNISVLVEIMAAFFSPLYVSDKKRKI